MRLTILASALVATAFGASAMTPADVTGAWYSEAKDAASSDRGDGIEVRNPDGTFVQIGRLCSGKQLALTTESGTWQLDGDMLTTRTTWVNGHAVKVTDFYIEHYRVSVEDAQHIVLVSQRDDAEKFHGRRVDAQFIMPLNPCADRR